MSDLVYTDTSGGKRVANIMLLNEGEIDDLRKTAMIRDFIYELGFVDDPQAGGDLLYVHSKDNSLKLFWMQSLEFVVTLGDESKSVRFDDRTLYNFVKETLDDIRGLWERKQG